MTNAEAMFASLLLAPVAGSVLAWLIVRWMNRIKPD